LLLIVAPFYLTYGLLLRRPIIRQLRRELNACRDDAELFVRAGKVQEDDQVLNLLRKRCHNAHVALDRIDLTHALLARTISLDEKISEERSRLDASVFKDIALRMDIIVLKAFAVNSPVLVMASALVCWLVIVFKGAKATGARVASRAWAAAYVPEMRQATA